MYLSVKKKKTKRIEDWITEPSLKPFEILFNSTHKNVEVTPLLLIAIEIKNSESNYWISIKLPIFRSLIDSTNSAVQAANKSFVPKPNTKIAYSSYQLNGSHRPDLVKGKSNTYTTGDNFDNSPIIPKEIAQRRYQSWTHLRPSNTIEARQMITHEMILACNITRKLQSRACRLSRSVNNPTDSRV